MARQLWLLRHGEAVPHDARASDDDRELTERGREQSLSAGLALAALDVAFQFVFTSPKVRAAETAALACRALAVEPVTHAPLREGFGADDAAELLHAAGEDRRVLIVGHNPDFEQVVHDLTGARIELKKGGVAAIRLEGTARGELMALLRPRELDRLAAAA